MLYQYTHGICNLPALKTKRCIQIPQRDGLVQKKAACGCKTSKICAAFVGQGATVHNVVNVSHACGSHTVDFIFANKSLDGTARGMTVTWPAFRVSTCMGPIKGSATGHSIHLRFLVNNECVACVPPIWAQTCPTRQPSRCRVSTRPLTSSPARFGVF